MEKFDETNLKYDVFLADHGHAVQVLRKEFVVVPDKLIAQDYLTFTVGLNQMIPVAKKGKGTIE